VVRVPPDGDEHQHAARIEQGSEYDNRVLDHRASGARTRNNFADGIRG
jgi:hypothetical protein